MMTIPSSLKLIRQFIDPLNPVSKEFCPDSREIFAHAMSKAGGMVCLDCVAASKNVQDLLRAFGISVEYEFQEVETRHPERL